MREFPLLEGIPSRERLFMLRISLKIQYLISDIYCLIKSEATVNFTLPDFLTLYNRRLLRQPQLSTENCLTDN